jgi:hypothetical protein
MDSLSLKFGCGYSGIATGTTASPSLKASLSGVARVSFTGSGKMVYVGTTVVAVSSTTTLDLTSGLTSPLNEAITGSIDFAKIYGVFIEHDVDSLSTTGITVLGGGSNDFQGPFAAGDKPTLLPGAWFAFGWDPTKAGWTVDGTHKNIALVNLDATALHTATVNVFLLGTV